MKFQAFGLICLLSGALAAPMQEQGQHSQEMQPHQDVPAPAPGPVIPPGVDEPELPPPEEGAEEGGEEGSEKGGEEGGENDPDMMMMGMGMMGQGQMHQAMGLDMDTFQQMVSDVENQVQQIGHVVEDHANDADGLMQALVDPMSRLNQTMAMGVSRLALPVGGLGALTGILGGGAAAGTVKKPAPLALLSDLLRAVSNLLENLLTRGPIGNLLSDLLGGVLGGVTGTVGGVLGGGALGGGAGNAVTDLLNGVLGSVGSILPGAGGVAAGLPVIGHP